MKYKEMQASAIAKGPKATRYQRIAAARQRFMSVMREKLISEGCKPIADFPDYLVSPRGVIHGISRGRVIRLSPGIKPGGYEFVGLYRNERAYYRMIHRIVAELFIENPEGKPAINHKDGDKRNNNVSNLEWVTHKENTAHAYEMGFLKRGLENPCAKLDLESVLAIRAAIGRYRDIGAQFGVSAQTICNIKRRQKSYANV